MHQVSLNGGSFVANTLQAKGVGRQGSPKSRKRSQVYDSIYAGANHGHKREAWRIGVNTTSRLDDVSTQRSHPCLTRKFRLRIYGYPCFVPDRFPESKQLLPAK